MKGFTYDQRYGTIAIVNGDFFAFLFAGSAGNQAGRNSPEHQCEKNVGPLPVGKYRMRVVSHPRFAAPAIRLDPFPENEMCGRSGFWIHGGTHSEGCILLQRKERSAIAALIACGFDTLSVFA